MLEFHMRRTARVTRRKVVLLKTNLQLHAGDTEAKKKRNKKNENVFFLDCEFGSIFFFFVFKPLIAKPSEARLKALISSNLRYCISLVFLLV